MRRAWKQGRAAELIDPDLLFHLERCRLSNNSYVFEVGLDLPAINQFNWPLSPAEYFTFREQSRSFEEIGLCYTGFGGNLYSANVRGRAP